MAQHLSEPAKFRRIDPKNDAALEGFSSGSDRYAHEVDETIASFRKGAANVTATVLLMEDTSGQILGAVGYSHRNLVTPAEGEIDAAVANFIGTRSTSRGYRMADGETLGGGLLRAAIEEINRDWDGSTPVIWTLMHRDNRVARDLFQRFGFAPLPTDDDYSILFRPARLPPPD